MSGRRVHFGSRRLGTLCGSSAASLSMDRTEVTCRTCLRFSHTVTHTLETMSRADIKRWVLPVLRQRAAAYHEAVARNERWKVEEAQSRRRRRAALEALDLGEVVEPAAGYFKVELGLGFRLELDHAERLMLVTPRSDDHPWYEQRRFITPEDAERLLRDLNLGSIIGLPDDDILANISP
jgi:hypothetical protein